MLDDHPHPPPSYSADARMHYAPILPPPPTSARSQSQSQSLPYASPYYPHGYQQSSVASSSAVRDGKYPAAHPQEYPSLNTQPLGPPSSAQPYYYNGPGHATDPSREPPTARSVDSYAARGPGKEGDADSPSPIAKGPVKRKRIQQACRSCGVRRVKCNGGHPCATCAKSGERCEYGTPKKRGPPKGSTRASSKVKATPNPAATQAPGPPRMVDSPGESASGHVWTSVSGGLGDDARARQLSQSSGMGSGPEWSAGEESRTYSRPASGDVSWHPPQPLAASATNDQLPYPRGSHSTHRYREDVHQQSPASPSAVASAGLLALQRDDARSGTAIVQQQQQQQHQQHQQHQQERAYLAHAPHQGSSDLAERFAPSFGDRPYASYTNAGHSSSRQPPFASDEAYRPRDAERSWHSQASPSIGAEYARSSAASGRAATTSSDAFITPLNHPASPSRMFYRGGTSGLPHIETQRSERRLPPIYPPNYNSPERLSHRQLPPLGPMHSPSLQPSAEDGRIGSVPTAHPETKRERAFTPWEQIYDDTKFADAALKSIYKERRRAHSRSKPSGAHAPGPDAAILDINMDDLSSTAPKPALPPRSSSPASSAPMNSIALDEPTIDESILDRLFQIFWAVIHPHWPMLYKPSLEISPDNVRLDAEEHPLLFNSICAIAASTWDTLIDSRSPFQSSATGEVQQTRSRASTTKHGGDGALSASSMPSGKQLGTVFFVRARYYLLRVNNEPSIEAIQALIFMALRESGAGRASQAAQYHGTACRMALDLGLHRHGDVSNAIGSSFTHSEDEARRRTFWCCYILDKTSAFMLGRPVALRDVEIDCPLPSTSEADEFELWVPTASVIAQAETIERFQYSPLHALSTLCAGIKLGRIAERIIGQYNLVKSKLEPHERDEPWQLVLKRSHDRLEQWLQALPEQLEWQKVANQLPHVLCLHLWFHACRIVLHRPYILKPAEGYDIPSCHAVCTQAANEIGNLLAAYEHHFSSRKLSSTFVYIVFTASTIHLANTTSNDKALAAQAKGRLRECMRWLSKFSETWDSASHHLHILERLGHGIDADLDGTALQRTEVIGASADEASNGAGVPMFANGRTYPGVDVGEGTVNPFSSIGTLVPLSAEQLQQPAQFAPSLVSNADAVDFSSEGALAPDGHAASTPFNAANRGSALGTNDAEAFLRLHDSAYWSAMPLTSEDPALWQNFTASYLEAIAGISGTRDVSSSTRADSTLEQAMSSGVRSSMGPAMPTASIAA